MLHAATLYVVFGSGLGRMKKLLQASQVIISESATGYTLQVKTQASYHRNAFKKDVINVIYFYKKYYKYLIFYRQCIESVNINVETIFQLFFYLWIK